jgi:hypothetical protein
MDKRQSEGRSGLLRQRRGTAEGDFPGAALFDYHTAFYERARLLEADSPLVIHLVAVLPFAVALWCLESIARNIKITQ